MLGLQAPCYATACRGTPREGIGHSDHSERLRPADSAAAAPHPARVLVIPRLRGLRSGVSYFIFFDTCFGAHSSRTVQLYVHVVGLGDAEEDTTLSQNGGEGGWH
jgi:hypothetical protein